MLCIRVHFFSNLPDKTVRRYCFCYSWQYCINRVRDYPNTGLGGAISHAYVKRYFHAENMRRVSVYCFEGT
jgi:hypothetical protein